MQSTPLVANPSATITRRQGLARAVLHKLLKGLTHGQLTLIEQYSEPTQTLHFGNPESGLQATLYLRDPEAYWKLLTGGSIGSGEAYFLEMCIRDRLRTDQAQCRMAALPQPHPNGLPV